MKENRPKIRLKKIAASVIMFGICDISSAAVLDGPGDNATIGANSPADYWNVKNAAFLKLTPGADTFNIAISSGAQLDADGATIQANGNVSPYGNTALGVGGSSAIIRNSSIIHSANLYTSVGMSVTQGGQATVENSSISTAGGRGVVISNLSTLSLIDSDVSAALSSTGNTSVGDGVGIQLLTANLNTTGGTVQGDQNAIWIVQTSAAQGTSSNVDIAGTRLISGSGAAIDVHVPGSSPVIANADITLRDGATAESPTGVLIDASKANVDLNILNTDISGNIVTSADTTLDATIDQEAIYRGNFNNSGSSTVNIEKAQWTGAAQNSGVLNVNIAQEGVWTVTGDSAVTNLLNAGSVAFSSGQAGRTLRVTGDYTGNNGLLTFNSVLADDDSLTDRLVIGGNTSGTTNVAVNNLGGSGAQTLNGIELITVGGISDGEFIQKGRIVAGAYDYRLVRGQGALAGNWYLSSEVSDNGGGDNGSGDNGSGDNGSGDNGGGDNGGGTSPAPQLVVRPEAGAYIANQYATRTMFNAPLESRPSETAYTDLQSGKKRYTSLWMLNNGSHSRARDNSGQLKMQSNHYSLMLGGDLAQGTTDSEATWRIGALAGYGYSRGNSVSSVSHYNAHNEVNGYTTGLYGSWFGSGQAGAGFYLDGVIQYSWFDNSVSGEDVASEKYKSKGLVASVETGYIYGLSENDNINIYLQPKIKTWWNSVKMDEHRESNGSLIKNEGSNDVTVSAGVRAFADINRSSGHNFRPFTEINWIHNTQDAAVSMDGVTVSQAGTRNIAEIKAGLEGEILPSLTLRASVGQQKGTQHYSDTAAELGIRYNF